MSYVSTTRRSESSASRRSLDVDTNEEIERDESKRRSRNLSEKKRRDQFNILINELSAMVTSTPRKMDKSTVLKATISFLRAHNEVSIQSQVQETAEKWKPSFLSNEEFTYLMLEALDGFIMVVSSSGKIIYVSESVTSLLGHLPCDLVRNAIYDFILQEERTKFASFLSAATSSEEKSICKHNYFATVVNVRLGGLDVKEDTKKYHLVKLSGYMKRWISSDCESDEFEINEDDDDDLEVAITKTVFVCTGRLLDSELLREMSVVVDATNTEFSSRHSLEWKFLFLDHRAPPIIGYLPFEVLGTSGYDYYHMDDLEKVATCHEALMQKGESTSCFYRFLTKGQQWIWLQTRYYVTYHQWNSKPEFIVGTHRVVSYADVMKELRAEMNQPFPRLNDIAVSHSKLGSRAKSLCSSSSSSSMMLKSGMKHGGVTESLMYGSLLTNKRSPHFGKLELPPPTISLALPISDPTIENVQRMGGYTSINNVCPSPFPLQQQLPDSQSSGISIALRPHMATYVQPSIGSPQGPPGTGVRIPFHLNPIPPNSFSDSIGGPTSQIPTPPQGHNSAILLPPTQSVLQEQLLIKHAELQRHIIQRQEELRLVSEQLLMSQCGIVQDPVLIPPQNSANMAVHQNPPHNDENILQLQQGYPGLFYPTIQTPGMEYQNLSPHHQT